MELFHNYKKFWKLFFFWNFSLVFSINKPFYNISFRGYIICNNTGIILIAYNHEKKITTYLADKADDNTFVYKKNLPDNICTMILYPEQKKLKIKFLNNTETEIDIDEEFDIY